MSEQKSNNEKKYDILSLRRSWARNDIRRNADISRKKLDAIVDDAHFEEGVEHQSKIRDRERKEFYEQKKAKGLVSEEYQREEMGTAGYMAKAQLAKKKETKKHKERFLSRIIRLLKGFSVTDKRLKDSSFITKEKKNSLNTVIFKDALEPYIEFFKDAGDTLWDFLCKFAEDLSDVVLMLVDVIITIGYYIGSFLLYLGDILWDIRFALEQKKRTLFMIFSTGVSVIAVMLILASSVSGYKYSYHGKPLGITKTKEDVYRAIDVLGDKLSEISDAEVNMNIGRDIEFTRVYGFKLNVDSSDTILNTITYMKDLKATAYSININGYPKVYLKNKEAADNMLVRYKNYFCKPAAGVEITGVNYKESVTIEEQQVLLGDIWNEDDAFKYLITGTKEDLPEGVAAMPLITIITTEIANYEDEIPFDIDYLENSSIYVDETELISDGVKGSESVRAEIVRVNGEEESRNILASTRLQNPINAVYYQGTKPIPERTGTGVFIFPLKCKYYWTTHFGERYHVAGVNPVHQGNDYACAEGNKIYASDGGTVVYAGYYSGYGLMVKIDHGGLYETIYGHCSKLLVSAGDDVYQDQNIALVGNTGVSTGPHLHFEVRYKGKAINPNKVLK